MQGTYVTPGSEAPLPLATVAAGEVVIDTNSIADVRGALAAFNPSFTVNVTPFGAAVTREWDTNPVLLENLTGSTQTVTPGFPPASVPVQLNLGDIVAFRDPAANPNFAFDVQFAFPFAEVSMRTQRELVQQGLGVASVIHEAHVGMFVPIRFDFETAEMEGEVTCNCLPPIPSQAPVCSRICLPEVECDNVTVFVKVNRLVGWLGIVPTLVAADANPNIPASWHVNQLSSNFLPSDPDGASPAFHLQTFLTSGDGTAAYFSPLDQGNYIAARELASAETQADVAAAANVTGCRANTGCELIGDSCDAFVALIAAFSADIEAKEQIDAELRGPLGAALFSDDAGIPTCVPNCTDSDDQVDLVRASVSYQLLDWFLRPFGFYDNGGYLLVNSLPTEIPPSVAAILGEGIQFPIIVGFDNDLDHDGVLTPVDPCPFISNAGPDTDQDGIGDSCDPCICDAFDDLDGDGVCGNTHCPNAPPSTFDNCTLAPNPLQRNCNLASERARREAFSDPVEILGDACDPVPCAAQQAQVNILTEDLIPVADIDAPGYLVCRDVDRSVMDVSPLASHQPIFGNPANGYEAVPVSQVPTHVRFCQVDLVALGYDCFTLPDFVRDDLVDDTDCAVNCAPGDLQETPLTRFHRLTTIVPNMATLLPDDPPEGMLFALQAEAGGAVARDWDAETDLDRWLVDGIINPPAQGIYGLRGTLWRHADTNVGALEHGEQLANNHYGIFDPRKVDCPFCIPAVDPPGPDEDSSLQSQSSQSTSFTTQAALAGAPYFQWRPPADTFGVDRYVRADAEDDEGNLVLAMSPDHVMAFTTMDDCGTEDVTPHTGSNFRQQLADPTLRWVNAAEPFVFMGAGDAFPMAVALNQTGDQLVTTITSNGMFMAADGDREGCDLGDPSSFELCAECSSGLCRAVPGARQCCDVACASDGDCPTGYCNPFNGFCGLGPRMGSPNAVDHVAVLTRTRRGIFVVGGSDPVTLQPTGEIWFTRLESDEWSAVPVEAHGYLPQRVLAATYSFATDRLYVLDETDDGAARLASIDPVSARAKVIGTWSRSPAWSRQWLVIDRDGSLLVASARPEKKPGKPDKGPHKNARSAIARLVFDESGAASVDGIAYAPKPLALPPLVDARGYTLVKRKNDHNFRTMAERQRELHYHAASLEDLGRQL